MWWNRLCDNVLPEKTMPFDLLTVLPTRLDVEVNGFNGGVLNGVPSAYHWYTEQYGVKWPVGYEVNISSQGDNFIQVDFDTPWCQPESDVIAELSRRFSCTLEHWYAEQGCDFAVPSPCTPSGKTCSSNGTSAALHASAYASALRTSTS